MQFMRMTNGLEEKKDDNSPDGLQEMDTSRERKDKSKSKKDREIERLQPESLSPEPLRESRKLDQGRRGRNKSKGSDRSQDISPDRSKTMKLNAKLKVKDLNDSRLGGDNADSARISRRISANVHQMMTDRPSSRNSIIGIVRTDSR